MSERPIALMPTLIRWWEALRAPDVAKWQQKYRDDWTPRMIESEELSEQWRLGHGHHLVVRARHHVFHSALCNVFGLSGFSGPLFSLFPAQEEEDTCVASVTCGTGQRW